MNKEEYKDFLNKEIKLNDEVIYIRLIRTGSSSKRKLMYKGKVLGFKGKKVEILEQYTNEYEIKEQNTHFIFPKDIVILGDSNE